MCALYSVVIWVGNYDHHLDGHITSACQKLKGFGQTRDNALQGLWWPVG